MKKLIISCIVTATVFVLASCDKDSTGTGTPENPPSDSLLIESILINPSSLELEAGDSATLTPIILPKQSGTVVLEWTSSDNTVATVSASGTVTAVSEGTATVTASSGEVHGSSTITVTAGSHRNSILYRQSGKGRSDPPGRPSGMHPWTGSRNIRRRIRPVAVRILPIRQDCRRMGKSQHRVHIHCHVLQFRRQYQQNARIQ